MKMLLASALVAFVASVAPAAEKSTDDEVKAVFAELRTLKGMEAGKTYTLSARGEKLTGRNDDFLRRRTAEEIADSKLSCGCGDYAAVFADRIAKRGYETRLIDSALISLHSLVNQFDGHVVVAIRPDGKKDTPWWLVDSTALNVISRDWATDAKSFTTLSGGVYWIGYCGPVEGYAVRTPEELKKFYAATLAQVPAEFFNRTLYRYTFTIDSSLRDEKGALLNPRVPRLQREQDELFARYRIAPAREVAIRLVRGADDATGDLKFSEADGWVSRVGLRSACSPSFLSYMDQKVRSREQSTVR